MKKLFFYRSLILCLILAVLPIFCLLIPGIKNYVIDNFMVSAAYNSVIIFIYVLGSISALFSIWQSLYSKNIIKYKNSMSHSSLLANFNKKLFSEKNKTSSRPLLKEISTEVSATRAQRVSFIISCSNVSTLIGLLGTFAGLSITISGIGSMLSETSHHSSDSSTDDTLDMIIHIISALSEPLRGMNTAFVSSIYGVMCAILLIGQSVFVRSAFSQLLGELKRLAFEHLETETTPNQVRTVRIESPEVSEFKKSFEDFCQYFVKNEENRNKETLQYHQKLMEALSGLNNHSFSEQSALLETIEVNQKTLMTQNEENGESLADIKKEISNQHDVLIDKTQEIQAEVESYKESFIPLLEKITSMYQKIVKKTLLRKRDEDENEK
ncbi:hypothetical protein GWK90_04815 [Candidatus Hamiltonella defensa]|uniref:Uncharacterized protein n=1 Tax=Candidatus Williamhamiltonella defendens TaxID=138072 RepID=A0A2D3TEW8_9ENTR|nr:MotA/TolQ/ExbB proton channel family protein [Candidatus Hamiltonella defensa]ASV33961.1 hypothetical protein CJJ18_08170 [Candidatus Hamiltonella defensa]ATW34335.1 hypothetical protein BJP43_08810 [Candidatus Hamiltonella defensa]AWK16914.1 hypothetical protein CCS40_07975 [Candidatus Hamiltonella defensa]MBK4361599.1 hypothetical protein [Candidatus Hamiltonella defensa]